MSKMEIKLFRLLLVINIALTIALVAISVYAFTRAGFSSFAEEAPEAKKVATGITDFSFVALAAAISVASSTIASGIALKAVASAGFAAVAERPELRSFLLILSGLAEGIAIYGILMGVIILGRI